MFVRKRRNRREAVAGMQQVLFSWRFVLDEESDCDLKISDDVIESD